jgi:branched-chain amino acid transport system ATP-binding protein
MPSLELHDLNVFYGEIRALWNVTLTVESHTMVCLIGSNGAGKSTLLKVIMGIVPPRSGEVLFDGKRMDVLSPDKVVEAGIVYVPEGRHPFPDFTVEENLRMGSFPARARHHYGEGIRAVYEIFPALKDRAKQRAGTLSGGEAQMLAIGRALMAKPKLLMLDEPSAGLSPVMVSRIFEAISSIMKGAITVLIVEQDVGRALSMSSMGYVLENGRITKSGSGEELLRDEYVKKAYLGI